MTPSKFDQLSAQLRHAFANQQLISGGVRYQAQLAQCQPDGTLDSLKRLDKLLMWVRRDLSTHGANESVVKEPDMRNFVLLVAFFVGQVIQEVRPEATWLTGETLAQHYPAFNPKSFFQLTAIADGGLADGVESAGMTPLFVLQIIATRLFGSVDRQFISPVDAKPIPDSLYRAVVAWLEQADLKPSSVTTLAIPTAVSAVPPTTMPTAEPTTLSVMPMQVPSSPTQTTRTDSTISATAMPSNLTVQDAMLQTATSQGAIRQTIAPQAKPPKPDAPPAKLANPKIFDEIKDDLNLLPAVNSSYQDDYIKASTALDKIDAYIHLQMAEQDVPADQVVIGDRASTAQTQALKLLFNTAKAGNTNAMIRLALCYFEGLGVASDPQKGVSLIQRAAEQNDSRAQKLLSKLYYQGVGVGQNVQLGEMWLAKAAGSGHPEAKKIQSYMNQVQLMKDTYQAETKKDKAFLGFLALAAVVLLFAIWMSVKYLK